MIVGILFSLLAVTALISICGEFLMRARLTRRALHDKIALWRRGGDEVVAAYELAFPGSRLPLFRRLAFWLLIGCAGVLLLLIFLRRLN
jgi:hypothetical protein